MRRKGSEALFERLKAMAKERGLGQRVIVNRTSCLKHCSRGVTVAVQPDNVWYAGVTEGDLEEICASHLESGPAGGPALHARHPLGVTLGQN